LQPAGIASPAVTTVLVELDVLLLLDPPPPPPPHAATSTHSAPATRNVREARDTRARIMPTFAMSAASFLSAYDHVILDLDGVVWVGDDPTPRAPEAVTALRDAGKGIAFVTNDGRHGDDDFVRKLWRLGFRASREEVVTVGGALQHALAESEHRTAYVVGSTTVHRHVADAGLRILNGSDLAARADVVVVAAHDDFDYGELRGAIQAVVRGAALVCAGRDATFPMPDGPWPGAGPIVAAIESGTGATAVSVGKPEPQLFLTALVRLGPGRAIVVGDRLDADVAGARAAGLDAAIVLTGATSAEEARAADPAPTRVAASLAELVLGRA
jgi:HAD superfamily hydrolase (TIGR01450 family)